MSSRTLAWSLRALAGICAVAAAISSQSDDPTLWTSTWGLASFILLGSSFCWFDWKLPASMLAPYAGFAHYITGTVGWLRLNTLEDVLYTQTGRELCSLVVLSLGMVLAVYHIQLTMTNGKGSAIAAFGGTLVSLSAALLVGMAYVHFATPAADPNVRVELRSIHDDEL